MKFKNLTGKTFGLWSVLKIDHKSGKTGVYYYDHRKYRSWVAIWHEGGKSRSKFFSVGKYGYDDAFKLACEFRDKTIQRLREEGYDYSNTHGE